MNGKVNEEDAVDSLVLNADRDVADYIARLTETMVQMTAGREMGTLRYFLEMVQAEAAELGKVPKQQ